MSEFSGLRVSGEGVLPPPDSGKGVRGTGDVCRRGSQDASVPSHLAATRGAARGKRRGTYSQTAKGKKFAPSPNFALQRCLARAPSHRGSHPWPGTRPAPSQAAQRWSPKVVPGGLGLLISLPAAIVENTELGMGPREEDLAAARPTPTHTHT